MQQGVDLVLAEAGQLHVEALLHEVLELQRQHFVVPAGVEGDAVVGDDVGAFFGLGPAGGHHDRDLGHAQALCGQRAAVAGNDAALLIDQDGRGPAPLLDRGDDLVDLLGRVGAAVAGVGDEIVGWAVGDL